MILCFTLLLHAGHVTRSDGEYRVIEAKNTEIIFADEYEKDARTVLSLIDALNANYEKNYGFALDETLKIVLASSNNQIANAFSIPVLNNTNVFYGSGATMVDYFASKSWLKTLMIHEIAHTYQLSAKDAKVSRRLHRVFGSNYLPILPGIPLPLFTYPNLLIPTFMLEGNAVLNESRFGNGGRLYSGRTKALFYALLKEGKLDITRMKNDHLDFPFTEEKYIVGGFFFLYLDMTYGTKRVNEFFKIHSRHYINPLRLSSSFVMTFGKTYDMVFRDFLDFFAPEARAMRYLDGKEVAFSKSYAKMNSDEAKLLFMTSDAVSRPVLHTLRRRDGALASRSGSWGMGKPFDVNGHIYTATNTKTAYNRIEYGLFDEGLDALEGTLSRYVMDRRQGSTLYFDLKSSFDEPMLYKDGRFIAKANSSALMDAEGHSYYFVQEGKQRTLYRDKTPLFSMDGYWSKVADIYGGVVYFVASTRYGASLFAYEAGKVWRVSEADNIVEARMINASQFLAETLEADGYHYRLGRIDPSRQMPINVVYPFEYRQEMEFFDYPEKAVGKKETYGELAWMEYTMLYPYYQFRSEENDILMLNAEFSDPIYFNSLTAGLYYDINSTITSLGYSNDRYRVAFGFGGYRVQEDDRPENSRDYGAYAYAQMPLYEEGRTSLGIELSGYQDDEDEEKNPLIAALHHTYSEMYGYSMQPNLLSDLTVYGKEDREERIYGGHYRFGYDLGWESFFLLQGQYSKARESGVKLTSDYEVYEDVTDVTLLGLDYTYYANRISKIGVGLEKVINIGHYFLYFPLSVRRESLFMDYNSVELEGLGGERLTIHETVYGMNFDFLFIHKLPFMASLKYIKNSESENDYQIFFDIGYRF